MIDRFGKEVAMRRYDETRIRVRVSVAVSRQFFGWLAGLGAAVRIESPEPVVRDAFCGSSAAVDVGLALCAHRAMGGDLAAHSLSRYST